jgi:hypothetical protein
MGADQRGPRSTVLDDELSTLLDDHLRRRFARPIPVEEAADLAWTLLWFSAAAYHKLLLVSAGELGAFVKYVARNSGPKG